MRRLDPLIGSDMGRLARKQGVQLVRRAISASGSMVRFADGAESPFASITWATGFRPNYRWLKVPVLDQHGTPVQRRGVTAVPGLSFVGLPWLHRRGAALLGGVGSDAAFLAAHIVAQLTPSSAEFAVSAS
jgi:putative flavoprotein involved in K+ transport